MQCAHMVRKLVNIILTMDARIDQCTRIAYIHLMQFV